METIRVFAPAKINLTLDVVGKRADGYHNLSTIMHEIPLADELSITIGSGEGVRAVTDVHYIRNDTNIAAKAGRLFLEKLWQSKDIPDDKPGILIEIRKMIPVGAGLGGGSTDAAAVLKTLNAYYKAPFSEAELLELGARVGADVPFCIKGGCALCEGIGEIITPYPTLKSGYLVLVKPKISISTAELFSEYQAARKQMRPDTAGVLKALAEGDFSGVAQRVYNVLEPAAEKRCGDITDIHKELLKRGAIGAAMSGSGSTVFGLFDSEPAAEEAAKYYSRRYKDTHLFKI